jgi:hypothetical protein
MAKTKKRAAVRDAGPDPVWGVCLGVFGLLNMAVAGALTKHWWFNFGEAFMLLGAVVFLGCVAITAARQEPLNLTKRLREWRDEE